MIEVLKDLLIQFASYFSIYEIGLLLGLFFLFIFFFTLGLLLRGRRFVAHFSFFLSALVILSAPIALQLVMQKVFYVIETRIDQAHAMQYTKGFFISGQIMNKGKLPINKCRMSANEVRDEKGSKILGVINTILPIQSFTTNLDIDIGVGKSAEFAVIVPGFKSNSPFYRVNVDCYLSNKFAQTPKFYSSLNIVQP